MVEHFLYEIRQFFPVRYGAGYESIFLREREIAGKKGVEHAFHFVTFDGTERTMRILLVPWDGDTAYYLILESGRFDFDKVDSDLGMLEKTLKLPDLKGAR